MPEKYTPGGFSTTAAAQPWRYVVTLTNPNKPREKPYHCWYTDDPAGLTLRDRFIARWNGHKDRGIFYCVGGLRERATAKREVIVAVYEIVVDLDLQNIKETRERIIEVLKGLPLPPSEIRDSGHGLHAIWFLKEPATGKDMTTAAAIMKKLSSLLASDASVTRPESLLRLPGTKNTKDLDPTLHRDCAVVWSSPTVADLFDFDDLLDSHQLLTPKEPAEAPKTDERTARHAGPDDDIAQGLVNVETRYAAMTFKGTGDNSIHRTQVACTASRLCWGLTVECTVEEALKHTRRAALGDPEHAGWDWGKEQHEIEDMCYTWVSKNPDLAHTLPEHLLADYSDQVVAGNPKPEIRADREGTWRVTPWKPIGCETLLSSTAAAPAWPTPYSARPRQPFRGASGCGAVTTCAASSHLPRRRALPAKANTVWSRLSAWPPAAT